jgi:predicted RNA-binding protein with PIN domain
MRPARKRLLVVDGYNVLNAWRPSLDSSSLADARDELARRLLDYAGFSGQEVILVFDAWMSDRMQRTQEVTGPLTVVFTQKNETADHYIERLCDSRAREVEYGRLEIRVATSDNVEQMVVLGRGAIRLSSRELLYEMDAVRREGRAGASRPKASGRTPVLDRLSEDVRRALDDMRRGQ